MKARIATILGVALTLQAASGSQMRLHFFSPRAAERAYTMMAEEALSFITKHIDEKPVIWLSSADRQQLDLPIVRGLGRCFYYTASFPEALPDPVVTQQPPMVDGRTMVIVDGQARGPEDIDRALRRFGYRFEVTTTQQFRVDEQHGVGITVGKAWSL